MSFKDPPPTSFRQNSADWKGNYDAAGGHASTAAGDPVRVSDEAIYSNIIFSSLVALLILGTYWIVSTLWNDFYTPNTINTKRSSHMLRRQTIKQMNDHLKRSSQSERPDSKVHVTETTQSLPTADSSDVLGLRAAAARAEKELKKAKKDSKPFFMDPEYLEQQLYRSAWLMKDRELLSWVGLDAFVFLQTIKLLIVMMTLLLIPAIFVLVPAYVYGKTASMGAHSIATEFLGANAQSDYFLRTTIKSVMPATLWITLIYNYYAFLVIFYGIYSFYRNLSVYRQAFNQNPSACVAQASLRRLARNVGSLSQARRLLDITGRSVLIYNVSSKYRKDNLVEMFERMGLGDVSSVVIIQNRSLIRNLLEKRNAALERLETQICAFHDALVEYLANRTNVKRSKLVEELQEKIRARFLQRHELITKLLDPSFLPELRAKKIIYKTEEDVKPEDHVVSHQQCWPCDGSKKRIPVQVDTLAHEYTKMINYDRQMNEAARMFDAEDEHFHRSGILQTSAFYIHNDSLEESMSMLNTVAAARGNASVLVDNGSIGINDGVESPHPNSARSFKSTNYDDVHIDQSKEEETRRSPSSLAAAGAGANGGIDNSTSSSFSHNEESDFFIKKRSIVSVKQMVKLHDNMRDYGLTMWGTSMPIVVVFGSHRSANIAQQCLLSGRPFSMDVKQAPSADDIIWENLYLPGMERFLRRLLGNVFYLLLNLMLPLGVVYISHVMDVQNLRQYQWLVPLTTAIPKLIPILNGVVSPMIINIMLSICPPILQFIARIQGVSSQSDVQIKTLQTYTWLLLGQTYVVLLLRMAIKIQINRVLNGELNHVVEMFSNSLPESSVLFFNLIIQRATITLPMFLLDPVQLFLRFFARYFRSGNYRYTAWSTCPSPVRFGFLYPEHILFVFLINLALIPISPLISLAGFLFTGASYFVHRHRFIYLIAPEHESGGRHWMFVPTPILVGCIAGQFFTLIQFSLVGMHLLPLLMIILLMVTIGSIVFIRNVFAERSLRVPLGPEGLFRAQAMAQSMLVTQMKTLKRVSFMTGDDEDGIIDSGTGEDGGEADVVASSRPCRPSEDAIPSSEVLSSVVMDQQKQQGVSASSPLRTEATESDAVPNAGTAEGLQTASETTALSSRERAQRKRDERRRQKTLLLEMHAKAQYQQEVSVGTFRYETIPFDFGEGSVACMGHIAGDDNDSLTSLRRRQSLLRRGFASLSASAGGDHHSSDAAGKAAAARGLSGSDDDESKTSNSNHNSHHASVLDEQNLSASRSTLQSVTAEFYLNPYLNPLVLDRHNSVHFPPTLIPALQMYLELSS